MMSKSCKRRKRYKRLKEKTQRWWRKIQLMKQRQKCSLQAERSKPKEAPAVVPVPVCTKIETPTIFQNICLKISNIARAFRPATQR